MIPVEFLWGALIAVFAVVGMGRGLWKELGVTTVLLLSLFALNLGERLIVSKFEANPPIGQLTNAPQGTIAALYYGLTIIFVAFISYQGITLEFPVKKQTGLLKWIFGYLGGLFNGYLIIGTIWNVIADAEYFGLKVPGANQTIAGSTTALHDQVIKFLPVSLLNANEIIPYVFLGVGMLLLLAIILK